MIDLVLSGCAGSRVFKAGHATEEGHPALPEIDRVTMGVGFSSGSVEVIVARCPTSVQVTVATLALVNAIP